LPFKYKRCAEGLSGGKDSWALIQILDELRKRAPIKFSIVAVNVDSGYEGYQHKAVAEACAARGWEFYSEHTTIGAVIEDKLHPDKTPCSLCARPRRGVPYRMADAVGPATGGPFLVQPLWGFQPLTTLSGRSTPNTRW